MKRLKIKEKKGITLISLVVTIVVILILSSITINMLLGENGILEQSTKAADSQKAATYRDKIEMALLHVQINLSTEDNGLSIDKITEEFSSSNQQDWISTVEKLQENNRVRLTTKDGYIFNVNLRDDGSYEIVNDGKINNA